MQDHDGAFDAVAGVRREMSDQSFVDEALVITQYSTEAR